MNVASSSHRGVVLSRSDGLQMLRDAWDCAVEMAQDPWQLAVEIQTLHRAGLTNTDLRWLLSCDLTQHGAETTRRSDRRRRFTKVRSLTLADDHCFILTAAGCRFLESHGFEQRNTPADFGTTASVKPVAARRGGPLRTRPEDAPAGNEPPPSETPAWNGDLHELWFGERMIKRYVRPAPAQELILSVFQEEKWPPGIDDPLPSKSCQDPKRRLHYTIQNLNRGQRPQRLHFFINGNGQLVRWRPIAAGRAGH